jgi:putative restriction endonuclease
MKSEFLFGHIDGIFEGQIFTNREELGLSGIHAPPQAGIWGRQNEGSVSIVLSGGYADDVDDWNYILYTGQGGQDAPGGKQVKDQEFTLGNKGLQLNKEYNNPVRVTRGYQLDKGPKQGYRYDGLYYVTDYEKVEGKEGYQVCRFHLQRENLRTEEEIEQSNSPAGRASKNVSAIVRNVKLRERIKEIYNHTCQVCDVYLKRPNSKNGIAVGAHIKGLGRPHNGPDVIGNMLCLCPNHHAQLDSYSFYIDPDTFTIVGLDDNPKESISKSIKHKVNAEYLKYHKEQYLKHN